MSRDNDYLLDILTAARLAIGYVEGRTEESFLTDVQCQDAVIRRLEIIGEAARRISAEFYAVLPELPWPEMIGMRNIMIHRYDDIDLNVVWESVQSSLPRLIATIERHLRA